MNDKTVLKKIMALLAIEKKEVNLAFAELGDGTTLESPSFDVGQEVFVVDGDEKTPAPDGEHELVLRDTEGEETRFKIFVEGGVITERENIEELEEEIVKVKEIPEAMEKVEDETTNLEEEEVEDDIVISMEEVSKKMEEMAYRIEELERKYNEMQEQEDEEEKVEEMEASKLDGAPVVNKPRNFTKQRNSASPQSSFLSKLYNN